MPEPKLLDRKSNSLDQSCNCEHPAGTFTDRVFGLWTVLGPAGPAAEAARGGNGPPRWECRCACGREVHVAHEELESGRSLCCGCREHAKVRKELEARRWQRVNRLWRRSGRDQPDKGWTAEMERALPLAASVPAVRVSRRPDKVSTSGRAPPRASAAAGQRRPALPVLQLLHPRLRCRGTGP